MSQYLTYTQYTDLGGHTLTSKNAVQYLTAASLRIDGLTFNRIEQLGGFDRLTPFQQDIIKRCVMEQADFEFENADVIDSPIISYSLNGASVQFGSGLGVEIIDNVAIKRSVAKALEQTGLMCQSLSWRRQ